MSAQLTYAQSPAIGFAGQIAENFTDPKQIDSGLLEDTHQTSTLTNDRVYEASNSVVVSVDGVAATGSPVTFTAGTDNAGTQALIAAALETSDAVTSVTLTSSLIYTVVFADYTAHVVTLVTTGGTNQAAMIQANTVVSTVSLVPGAPVVFGTTDAQYKVAAIDSAPKGVAVHVSGKEQAADGSVKFTDLGAFPIMKKGRFYGVAGSALSKGASVSYHVANGKYVADGTGTTDAFVTTVTSAEADGDIIILSIDKV
jgi:hypothetical protein